MKLQYYYFIKMDFMHFGFTCFFPILCCIPQITDATEYCEGDYFEARCATNEVIIINSASYGRMALGRCVTLDIYLGCSGDVLDIVRHWCSGKQTCKRKIDKVDFAGVHSCPNEIDGYLVPNYRCHKALQIPSSSCGGRVQIQDQSSYISLKNLRINECATSNTPLMLEAKLGQYFNITLLDFSPKSERTQSQRGCSKRYGIIRDLSNNREVPLCSGDGKEQQLVLSNGNTVQLVVDHLQPKDNVLLRYTVIGCEDLKPIPGATMHRKGTALVVECSDNVKAWTLQCQDNQWIGTYDECTKPGNSQTREETEASEKRINISHEFIVIAAGTVVLFASGVIVCVGVLYLCNRRSKHQHNQMQYSCTYNPRTHDVTMHTIQWPQIPDFNGTHQRTWSRQEMPDVVDQTLTRTLPPPVPVPVMGESIYENPGQLIRGSGSCIYSSVHTDNPDQAESDYSDSMKYYVLEQNEHPCYTNTN